MKKTIDANQATSSILKYILHLIGIALFYGFILYTTIHVWLPLLSGSVSKVSYVAYASNNLRPLLGMYALFCYLSNNFLLKLYERGKTKPLILSILADVLVLPLGLLITVIYNNLTIKSRIAEIDEVYNIYIITILLVIKEVIAAQIILKKDSPRKKA